MLMKAPDALYPLRIGIRPDFLSSFTKTVKGENLRLLIILKIIILFSSSV